MHTVELLEQALALAEALGYQIRQEWLDGGGGGVCEIAGKKWVFIDLALGTADQLDELIEGLREDPDLGNAEIPAALAPLMRPRRAA